MKSRGQMAIVIDAADNVATAITSCTAGSYVTVKMGDKERKILAKSNIPFLHKLALKDITEGENIIKYGQSIGRATVPIKKGEHVHTHNMCSVRGHTSIGFTKDDKEGATFPFVTKTALADLVGIKRNRHRFLKHDRS